MWPDKGHHVRGDDGICGRRVFRRSRFFCFLDDCQDGHDVQSIIVTEHQETLFGGAGAIGGLEGDVLDDFSVFVEPREEFHDYLARRTGTGRGCGGVLVVVVIGTRVVIGVAQEEVIVLVDKTQELTGRDGKG